MTVVRAVVTWAGTIMRAIVRVVTRCAACLLYTSDAADDMQRVDLGGGRIIKKKKIKS